jgi:hypothetical protein
MIKRGNYYTYYNSGLVVEVLNVIELIGIVIGFVVIQMERRIVVTSYEDDLLNVLNDEILTSKVFKPSEVVRISEFVNEKDFDSIGYIVSVYKMLQYTNNSPTFMKRWLYGDNKFLACKKPAEVLLHYKNGLTLVYELLSSRN